MEGKWVSVDSLDMAMNLMKDRSVLKRGEDQLRGIYFVRWSGFEWRIPSTGVGKAESGEETKNQHRAEASFSVTRNAERGIWTNRRPKATVIQNNT